ncbi:MAG TPA: hypothetical protein PKA54_04505 [Chitinophagaceae bacterium]|nr:hypothetical protein [Chitinophagaceae bacterium]
MKSRFLIAKILYCLTQHSLKVDAELIHPVFLIKNLSSFQLAALFMMSLLTCLNDLLSRIIWS